MRISKPLVVIGALAAAAALFGLRAGLSPGGGTAAHTITYDVSGDAAGVTYGPAGSSLRGSVPMDASSPAGDAPYYFIWAQLSGTGTVSCQISVDGTVLSQAVANAAYGVAQCEIVRHGDGWASATG